MIATNGGTEAPPTLLERMIGRIPHVSVLANIIKRSNVQDVQFQANEYYRSILSHWHNPNELVLSSSELHGPLFDKNLDNEFNSILDRMQYLDSVMYMPDDILTKVDRASMWHALEVRVPLLDHRVVEASWNLPQNFKIRDGETKWVLRQILDRHVPRELFDRPKMGFGIPIADWLRGPLKDWADGLLNKETLIAQGIFNADILRERWEAHMRAEQDWAYPLWTALMALSWLQENKDIET